MSIIERDQILTMIPHAGTMCLLDAVLDWNEHSVRCLSRRYRQQDNPLRRADGVLGAACGIEIAAQAMAVQGRLTSGAGGPPSGGGYLASLRDVQLRAGRLDAIDGDLIIEAERLMGDARGASYRFTLAAQGVELLSGRATVLFGAGA
ncbi:MAG: phosphotransferase [Acidocella sp.]|nr:phosphotransferase [Acidocella sp.]